MRFFILVAAVFAAFACALFAQTPQGVTTGSVNAVQEAYNNAYKLAEQGAQITVPQGFLNRGAKAFLRQPCLESNSASIISIKNVICLIRFLNKQVVQTRDAVAEQYAQELAVASSRLETNLQTLDKPFSSAPNPIANLAASPKNSQQRAFSSATFVGKTKADEKNEEAGKTAAMMSAYNSAIYVMRPKFEELVKYLKIKI